MTMSKFWRSSGMAVALAAMTAALVPTTASAQDRQPRGDRGGRVAEQPRGERPSVRQERPSFRENGRSERAEQPRQQPRPSAQAPVAQRPGTAAQPARPADRRIERRDDRPSPPTANRPAPDRRPDARPDNRPSWQQGNRWQQNRGDDRRDWQQNRRDDRRDWRSDRRDDRRDWRSDRRDDRPGANAPDRRDWNRGWRNDNRYDWQRYRDNNRRIYRPGIYNAPIRGYRYNRFNIGLTIGSPFYSQRYWINDPWQYRLPPAYGSYRWVRYYDDVLLVDTYAGRVVDVIYDFFW